MTPVLTLPQRDTFFESEFGSGNPFTIGIPSDAMGDVRSQNTSP